MARIDLTDFNEIQKEKINLQDKVPATWCIANIGDEKFLQIETYGRNGTHRKNRNHPTQVLQLDREVLINILRIAIEKKII